MKLPVCTLVLLLGVNDTLASEQHAAKVDKAGLAEQVTATAAPTKTKRRRPAMSTVKIEDTRLPAWQRGIRVRRGASLQSFPSTGSVAPHLIPGVRCWSGTGVYVTCTKP